MTENLTCPQLIKNTPKELNPDFRNDGTRQRIAETLEGGTDQFLEYPPKQPKREVGDYIEGMGILVPIRFENLEQALEHVKRGGEIIVRSEHPQEYSGASGLLKSYIINQKKINKGKKYCAKHGINIDWKSFKTNLDIRVGSCIQDQILGQLKTFSQHDYEGFLKKLSEKNIRIYCELSGLDFEDFIKNISYSYWEKIGGLNRSIIADNAIPNRYHIFTNDRVNDNFNNYLIIDNGNIVLNLPMRITKKLYRELPGVIEFYEKIRGMRKFDVNHCPIVEFQTDNKGENYFLQYHRTRQTEPANFTLNRDLEEDEFEATYCRGATTPDGLVLNTAMYYPPRNLIVEQEEGSFDYHNNFIFSEIMSRRRIAYFEDQSIINLSISCIDHLPKSRLFNSQITIYLPKGKITNDLKDYLFEKTIKTNEPAKIPIRVISDGRKAYVKLMI